MRRKSAGWICLALALSSNPANAEPVRVAGRVLAQDGSPVAGAEIGPFWNADGPKMMAIGGGKTDADGRFQQSFEFYGRPGALLAIDPDRKAGGLVVVDPAKVPDSIEIRTTPLVRVRGDFSCRELGKRPEVAIVYMYLGAGPEKIRLAQCLARGEPKFEFRLPVGDYGLHGYSSDDYKQVNRKLTLGVDKTDLDLGTIDLPASPLGKLYGKEPPPLHVTDARGIGKDVKLSDFKGKWVVLDFWGYWCGPCVGRSLPSLMEIHEEYAEHRDKFVILAFHDKQAKDFDELDAKLAPIIRDVWQGKPLPFPILLDSTGQTVEDYGIVHWPTTILIDPEGRLVRGEEGTLIQHLPPIPVARRIPHALDRQVGFGCDGIPLDRFAQRLAGMARLKISIDDEALKSAGIARNAPIPLTLSGQVSLRSWLDLALTPLGLVAVPGPEGLVVTVAKPGDAGTPDPSAPQKNCAERIGSKLDDKAAFDFRDRTLAEVAAHFEAKTGENFVLDPGDRKAGRLDPSTTVTGKADGVPLRDALKALLGPAGIEAVVRDEVVVFTKSRP